MSGRGWWGKKQESPANHKDRLKIPIDIIKAVHTLGPEASRFNILNVCESNRRQTISHYLDRLLNDGLLEINRGKVGGRAGDLCRLKPAFEYPTTKKLTLIFHIAEETTKWFEMECGRLGKQANVNYEKIKQGKVPGGDSEIYSELMTVYSHTIFVWQIAESAMLHSQSLSTRKIASYPMYNIGQITELVTSHYWGDVKTLRIDEVMERWESTVFSSTEERDEWKRLLKNIDLETPEGDFGIEERHHLANLILELQKESLPDKKTEP